MVIPKCTPVETKVRISVSLVRVLSLTYSMWGILGNGDVVGIGLAGSAIVHIGY